MEWLAIMIMVGAAGLYALAYKVEKKKPGTLGAMISELPASALTLQEIVKREASRNGLRASLVMAVIDKESGFRPTERGAAGEVGLMQIRQVALDDYNKRNSPKHTLSDLFEPSTNVKVGTWYLGWIKDTFSLNDSDTLQAYNGGIGNLLKKKVSSDAKAYAVDVLTRESKFA